MDIGIYNYKDEYFNHSHEYLIPELLRVLVKYHKAKNIPIFDMGCGNGSTANFLFNQGFFIHGVDPSREGIELAQRNFPHLNLEIGHSGDNLHTRFGSFDLVYSLEVIEHVFDPFDFIEDVSTIVNKEGILILSTPYHGYVKNLVLSIFNKWDKHFTALWRGGHIKFWSPASLTQLLNGSGFRVLEIRRVGRIPIIAKSMVVIAQKQ